MDLNTKSDGQIQLIINLPNAQHLLSTFVRHNVIVDDTHCFSYKAFVTGFASNLSYVLSSVSLERSSGLWASDTCCNACMQQNDL